MNFHHPYQYQRRSATIDETSLRKHDKKEEKSQAKPPSTKASKVPISVKSSSKVDEIAKAFSKRGVKYGQRNPIKTKPTSTTMSVAIVSGSPSFDKPAKPSRKKKQKAKSKIIAANYNDENDSKKGEIIKELRQELEKLKLEKTANEDKLQKDMADLKRDKRQSIDGKNVEIKRLSERNRALQRDITRMNKKQTEYDGKYKKQLKVTQRIENAVRNIENQSLTVKSEAIESLQDELEASQMIVNDMKESLGMKLEEIVSLQYQLSQKDIEISNIKQMNKKYDEQLQGTLESQGNIIRSLKIDINSFQQRIEE